MPSPPLATGGKPRESRKLRQPLRDLHRAGSGLGASRDGADGGCLCIGCLEKRIGRVMRPKDFEREHPFNMVPGTPRLMKRQGRILPPSPKEHEMTDRVLNIDYKYCDRTIRTSDCRSSAISAVLRSR